jgi:hypothetical protein
MRTVFFIAFLFAGFCLQAQDTLYTVSGQKIPAKVVEINQSEIKYKKASNLDGPVYVIDKTDVALIEYKNGSKELFGTGSGSNNDDQQVANAPNPKPRVNIILGGGWGWGWNWGWNNWGYWGGYRAWPRVRHHHNHHYYGGGGRHYHYGRRGR